MTTDDPHSRSSTTSEESTSDQFHFSLTKRSDVENSKGQKSREIFEYSSTVKQQKKKLEEINVKFREQKRIEIINAKRNKFSRSVSQQTIEAEISESNQTGSNWSQTVQEISQCQSKICSEGNPHEKLQALQKLREISATLVSNPETCYMGVQLVMDSSVVGCMCKILQSEHASCDQQHSFSKKEMVQNIQLESEFLFQIRLEITWIFINLSMGNPKQQRQLKNRGVIQSLISQVQMEYQELNQNSAEQFIMILTLSVWALGNFIVEDVVTRDLVLQQGVLAKIASLYDVLMTFPDFRQEVVFFIHNCFVNIEEETEKCVSLPQLGLVTPGLRIIAHVIDLLNAIDYSEVKGEDMIMQTLTTFYRISEHHPDILDALAKQYNFHAPLIKIFQHSSNVKLQCFSLSLISRLCAQSKLNENVMQFLSVTSETKSGTQCDILMAFKQILQDEDIQVKGSILKRKVCLALSNMIADKSQHVLPILLESGIHQDALLPILLQEKNYEQFSEDRELQAEIAYCFSNAFVSTKKFDVVYQLVFEHKFMMALVSLLERSSSSGGSITTARATGVALEGLNLLFATVSKHTIKAAQNQPIYSQPPAIDEFLVHLEALNGVDLLEQCQLHDSEKVYELANSFLTLHFEQNLSEFPPFERDLLLEIQGFQSTK